MKVLFSLVASLASIAKTEYGVHNGILMFQPTVAYIRDGDSKALIGGRLRIYGGKRKICRSYVGIFTV